MEAVVGSGRLFETKVGKGRVAYRLFASTVFVGICLIWIYRLTNIPSAQEGRRRRLAWIGMLISELFFGCFWVITQSARWNISYRRPFKDRLRLSHRYEKKLPGVDIFVCTADPKLEPPTMVINTILSAMSFNYPTEKLSIYLSDDGGSEFIFYALLEASQFSKHWLPFCYKFKIEPRSPSVYFSGGKLDSPDREFAQDLSAIKKLYENMKIRIETAIEKGSIPKEIKDQHKGFSEWNCKFTKQDHQSVVQILIDGRNPDAVDTNGNRLPTLVYLAREKKTQWPHNFKAGSMNALIRVSSVISNAPIILNLDCDMYVNDSEAIKEALCFFLDEKQGHEVSYVQYPQCYDNVTKNDMYASAASAIHKIELHGIAGYGTALYCGTGCFHRRTALCGRKYIKESISERNNVNDWITDRTVNELEEDSKAVANCEYEIDRQWGKQMGLVYGCPVEDIITGLTIQCRGWKSIYYYPDRNAFVGSVPLTLDIALVQHKRWCEGLFQIFISRYCPFIYGHTKIKLGAQMGYCIYLLWPSVSLPLLYYLTVPSLCLLRGIPLFPQVLNLWFLPFAYVFVSRNVCSLAEGLSSGETLKGWWNGQRMWVIRRTTAYFCAFVDTIIGQLGFSQTAFAVTAKVVKADVWKRYEKEIMEFGSTSIMFTILSTLALLNLFSLFWGVKRFVFDMDLKSVGSLIPNAVLSGLMVLISLPVYQALFVRRDKGRIPFPVVLKSVAIASIACVAAVY